MFSQSLDRHEMLGNVAVGTRHQWVHVLPLTFMVMATTLPLSSTGVENLTSNLFYEEWEMQ